jgi:hypothetical protein
MRLVNSDNGHLWYAKDEEGFIRFVSLFKDKVVEFIESKK